jgi:N-acetyl-beta-hexosaminidase
MTDKRNIKELIEKEAPNLNNLLDPEEVKIFKGLTEELRDTWTKKQMFRTETEMQFSVLNDAKYPTKAAKYWQCVREQNVFLENLMTLSFDYRRAEVKIKRLQEKLDKEEDQLKRELLQIDIDEKTYSKASMQLVARDRMREIKLWSKFKKKFDDGSFDTKNVNTHQLNSYHLTMKNKAETLTSGSSQPEVFNVLGQLQSIERIKKDIQIENKKKENAKLEFEKNSIGQQD